MKYKVLTTVDKKHTEEVMLKVQARYKALKLDFTYKVFESDLDVSHPALYEFNWSRSFQELKLIKSVKRSVMSLLVDREYTGTILFVDDNKAPQQETLRGQHSTLSNNDYYALIEIYSEPGLNIRKTESRDKTYYSDTTRKSDWLHDEYVTFHEIGHNVEKRVGHPNNTMHIAIEEDRLEQYLTHAISELLEAKVKKRNCF
jgi:hypothetical protein